MPPAIAHPFAMPPARPDLSAPGLRPYAGLIGIVTLCSLIEAVLLAADYGLIGSAGWRALAYQYGGFWAGLLYDWRPNYAAQPVLMFLTYGVLHAGPGHLIGNMLALAGLGRAVLDRQGPWRFAGLYGVAMLGGAAGFGLLSRSPSPMIGASGAIFGLAAALVVWAGFERHRAGCRGWAVAGPVMAGMAGLAALNMISWVALGGQLAWQAHFGGALAGAGFALVYRRPRPAPCAENIRS